MQDFLRDKKSHKAEAPSVSEQNWKRLLTNYDRDQAHEEFFHYICQSRNFSFGIHCYRQMIAAQGMDPTAEKMIRRLYAAMQIYWKADEEPAESWVSKHKWNLVGSVLVLVIFVTAANQEDKRMLIGFGVVGMILLLGLNSKWLSKI